MKIDKNVPIPKTKTDYAKDLEIGDSILFDTYPQTRSFASIVSKLGNKTTTHKVEGGFRVWRVK